MDLAAAAYSRALLCFLNTNQNQQSRAREQAAAREGVKYPG